MVVVIAAVVVETVVVGVVDVRAWVVGTVEVMVVGLIVDGEMKLASFVSHMKINLTFLTVLW